MNETQRKQNPSYGSHPPANALSREQLQQRMQAALQDGQGKPVRKRPPRPYAEAEADSVAEPKETKKHPRRKAFPPEHLNHNAVDPEEETGYSYNGFDSYDSYDSYDEYDDENRYSREAEEEPPRPVRTKRKPRPNPPVSEPAETAVKSGTGKKIALLVSLIVVIALLAAYLIGFFSYQNRMLPNTRVNGIDVSGMTVAEAEQNILSQANAKGITFVKKDGEEVPFSGDQFGSNVSLSSNAVLLDAVQNGHGAWFTSFFHPTDLTVSVVNSYSEEELSDLIKNYTWGTVAPTDAKIEKNADDTYEIVPEKEGDLVDADTLTAYTLEQMKDGNNTISLTDANCYLQPEITSEDLQDKLADYNRFSDLTITYDFDDRQEVLEPETISEWITVDENDDSVDVDRDAVTSWVNKNLVKYDTYGSDYMRTFHSTLQGTLEIPGGEYGIYGWLTDVDATVDKLIEYIQDGESVTVEPEYARTGYCRATDDIGDSYAEVDITNQKVFVYKDGELVIESDCVTGMANDPSRETPPGVYKVWSMDRNRILGTYETYGYAQPVDYWIYFTEIDIGFHDLARSAYGGDIYKTNGSHGCVNLPLDVAAELYDTVEIGYPVIVIA